VIEHKAVLDTCKRLEKYGYEVTYLPVGKDGRIDLDDLRRAITSKTILSRYYANNEIGVIQPIQEIGKIAKGKGRLVPYRRRAGARQSSGGRATRQHRYDLADGAQLTARRAAALSTCGVAILACSFGADRWRRTRARNALGTLNVPGIVGFGKAAELCRTRWRRKAFACAGCVTG